MDSLHSAEIKRYSRHILLPEIGIEGQQKLKKASVLVVGAGGLGSPLLTYLAASGVGRIGIVDYDYVDASNLQRQILFSSNEIGKRKTKEAKDRLTALNPFVKVETYSTKLTRENAKSIIEQYDIVADGTDNFPTRYLVNDVCMQLDKPNVYASIFGFEGQASVFVKGQGPCYRCLFPHPPAEGSVPSCNEAGVLGVLPGILGTIQASEVVKLILRIGTSLVGRLLSYDALEMKFDEVTLKANPECSVCSDSPGIVSPIDYEAYCEVQQEPKSDNIKIEEISPLMLQEKMHSKDDFLLLDIREAYELKICELPGAKHIRMDEVKHNLEKLSVDKDIVVFCHLGVRSKGVAEYLLNAGFKKVYNLQGGIDLFAQQCDSSIQRY